MNIKLTKPKSINNTNVNNPNTNQVNSDSRRASERTFSENIGIIFGRTPAETAEAIIMWGLTFLMLYISYHLHAAYYSGNPDALGEFFKRVGLA